MTRAVRLLSLAALLAVPAVGAQARPVRPAVAAPVQPSPAVKARAAVMDRFSARMGRLDALMGPSRPVRARSASAEH